MSTLATVSALIREAPQSAFSVPVKIRRRWVCVGMPLLLVRLR